MRVVLLLAAVLVFGYWLFGASQPFANKPEVFRGVTGGIWILGLALLLGVLGFFL